MGNIAGTSAATLALLTGLGAASAKASCQVDDVALELGRSASAVMHIAEGDQCGIRITLQTLSMIDIRLTKPRHGAVGWNQMVDVPEIRYRFNEGYRGPDDFAIDIVGFPAANHEASVRFSVAHVAVHVEAP